MGLFNHQLKICMNIMTIILLIRLEHETNAGKDITKIGEKPVRAGVLINRIRVTSFPHVSDSIVRPVNHEREVLTGVQL